MYANQSLLCDAISQSRSVSFWYGGGSRVVDPHSVYESSTGKILVDAYQTSGYSESGESVEWKRFEVDQRRKGVKSLVDGTLPPPSGKSR